VRVFCALGGNFAAATPDSQRTAAAMAQCALTIHVATKPNRNLCAHGKTSILLPCLARSERDRQASGLQRVSVEDSMSEVHASQGALDPASEHVRSEVAIVAGIGAATFGENPVSWSAMAADYRRIRSAIAAVLPDFADFETKLDVPGGFRLPNAARERSWRTGTSRAALRLAPYPDQTLPEGQLRLMTIRSHDQYNTTIYGDDDRYRGIIGERRVVFCHGDDVVALGLAEHQRVDLISCFADRERIVRDFRVVVYDIPRGCAAAYFPEANPLVALESIAAGSRTPTSKSIPIRLQPTVGNAVLV
jgi:anaerobic selenocysteine-containing dehydrogenase